MELLDEVIMIGALEEILGEYEEEVD